MRYGGCGGSRGESEGPEDGWCHARELGRRQVLGGISSEEGLRERGGTLGGIAGGLQICVWVKERLWRREYIIRETSLYIAERAVKETQISQTRDI